MQGALLEQARRLTGDAQRDYLEQLALLCAENSFSFNPQGVAENARIISEMFLPLGFRARHVPSRDARQGAHLLLERRGTSPNYVTVLSHLDTVYRIEDESRHDFRFRIDGDLAYGPGVVDIKGGTLLVLHALKVLAEVDAASFERVGWKVLLNAAEESGSLCFPDLLREEIDEHCLACLVYEHGTDLGADVSAITEARRGSARFRVEARGRSAHSGSGHARGANAIHQLALTVAQIEELSDPDKAQTFCVGRIEGGTAINTVPNQASALVDMRADDPAVYQQASQRIHALAGSGSVRARSDGFATSVHVEDLPGYPPWPRNSASQELAQRAIEAARAVGQELRPEFRLGASDGCHTWTWVPTLDGLGPLGGSIHCPVHDPAAGKTQEHLLISSIAPRMLLNVALYADLATGAEP